MLFERVEMIEQLASHAQSLGPASLRSRGLFFALERFHLNHLQAYGSDSEKSIEMLIQKLATLNCRTVVLTIPESEIENRLQRRDYKGWAALSAAEKDVEKNTYLGQQSRLVDLASRSEAARIVDSSGEDWQTIAKCIMDEIPI